MEPNVDDKEAKPSGEKAGHESHEIEAPTRKGEASRGDTDERLAARDEVWREDNSNVDPDDLESDGSRSWRPIYSESPVRLSLSASPTRKSSKERRGVDDDELPGGRLSDTAFNSDEWDRNENEAMRREPRPYQISNSHNASRKGSASPSAKHEDQNDEAMRKNGTARNDEFDGRLEERDLQAYFVRGISNSGNEFGIGADRRQDGYQTHSGFDDFVPVRRPGPSRRQYSPVERDRMANFNDERRFEGSRFERESERERIRSNPGLGRERLIYDERDGPNDFAQRTPPRAQSRERLRPGYSRPPPPPRIIYERPRSRNRSASSIHLPLPRARVVEHDSELPRYIRPIGRAGMSLKVDVNLTPATSDERLSYHAKHPLTPGSHPWQSLHFETSCGTINESGTETVILAQKTLGETGEAAHIRWIHMQQAHMSLESLQDILISADISDDDLLMTLRLLRQVAAKAEKEVNHSYVLDHLVIRGDSSPIQYEDDSPYVRRRERQPDRHCTFVSFPYFSLQQLVPAQHLMITYSPHSLASMVGESIQIQKSLPRLRSKPSILRITDAFQKTLFFPLNLCKSYFEVEELVYSQFELSPYSHSILLPDKTILKPSRWPPLLISTKSAFIELVIDAKEDPYSIYYESDGWTSNSESDVAGLKDRPQSRHPVVSERRRHRVPVAEQPIIIERPIIADDWRTRNRSQTRRRTGDTVTRRHNEPTYGDSRALVLAKGFNSNYQHQDHSPWMPEENEYPVVVRDPRRQNAYSLDWSLSDSQEYPHDQSRALVLYQNPTARSQIYPDRRQLEPAPAPRRNSIHVDNDRYQNLRRSSTVDRSYYNNRIIEPYVPTTRRRYEPDSIESTSYSYLRSRPPPNGVIVNNTIEEEIEDAQLDMYFIPRTRRHSTGKEGTSSNAKAHAGDAGTGKRTPSNLNPRNSKSAELFGKSGNQATSTATDASERQPIIPIFLWPTGPPAPTEKSQKKIDTWSNVSNTGSTTSVDLNSEQGPPCNTSSVKVLSQDSIRSLSEVLQGLDESFTDETHPGGLFRSMEASEERGFFIQKPRQRPPRPNHGHRSFDRLGSDRHLSRPRTHPTRGSASSSDESLAKRLAGPVHGTRVRRERQLRDSEREADRRRAFIAAQDEEIRRRPAVPAPPSRRPTRQQQLSPSSEYLSQKYKEAGDHVERPLYSEQLQQKAVEPVEKNSEKKLRGAEYDDLISDRDETNKQRQIYPSDYLEARKRSFQDHTGRGNNDDPIVENLTDDPDVEVEIESSQVHDSVLYDFVTRSEELLTKFIPPEDTNIVTGKYFGAIKKSVKLVQKIYDDCYSENQFQSAEVWVIDDISMVLHNYYQFLPRPSTPLNSCEKCTNRAPYRTELEASQHLIYEHFQDVEEMTTDQTKLWIKQEKQKMKGDKRRYRQSFKILKSCNSILKKANKKIREIHDGVYSSDGTLSTCYRLPNALVESFRMILGILLWTSFALERVAEGIDTSASWTRDDKAKASSARHHMTSLGRSLMEVIGDGRLDLLAMIRTQQQSKNIRKTQGIGPQYILAMVLSNLQLGVDCEDLIEVYKRYIERLSFQANQFPRRRLIRSFIYLDEETKIIYETLTEQLNLLTDLYRVLDPCSFRTTTTSRVSQYALETDLILKIQAGMEVKRADLLEMGFQIERLMQQTKTSLEIKDDDHGKAILVFTTVTLVFLPLSFVSSFFGMNTVDIRDMDSGQSRFWVVAIPVTVVVLVLALWVGYKLEAIREWFEGITGKLKRD